MRWTSRRQKVLALLLGTGLSLLLFEGACQVFALYLAIQWNKVRADPGHYYTACASGRLRFEVASNVRLEEDGRVLQTNSYGIREAGDGRYEDKVKIAVFGDSVAFGMGLSQEQTISAMLQERLDPQGARIKVLNLGGPGYATAELLEHLRNKNEIYHVDHVYYVLSPNDFCRRDTVREGGDGGLYRMYHMPLLKSPWMVRKAIYRLRAGGLTTGSVPWHQWLYRGGRERGCADIRAMGEYARQQGATFTVVPLPAVCAYDGGGYVLQDMEDDIIACLGAAGIPAIDLVATMGKDPGRYLMRTNHLHPEGNRVLADVLADDWRRRSPVATPP